MTEAERQYERIIQRLTDAIYVCDVFGRVKLFNNAAVQLWGRKPEIGKDMFCGSWKVLSKNGTCLSLEEHPVSITLAQKKSLDDIEIIIQRPDGNFRNILNSTTPIFNVNGELTGAVNLITDITAKSDKKGSQK